MVEPIEQDPNQDPAPRGSWAKTYAVVLLLHVAWIGLLLAMTLLWNRRVPQ